MSNKVKAHIALLVSGLLFGANYWIAKGIMPDPMLPRQIIFIRVFSAAVLFWVLSLTFKKETVSKKHLLLIALSSALGVAVNQIFFFEGLNLTTPVDAAILHATSPIMVLIFAAWVIREKVLFINMVGVILGAAGALLLIISGKDVAVFRGDLLGNIFILINLVAYALYLVLIKPIMEIYHPFTVMKWVFVFGLIAVTPFTMHTLLDFKMQVLTGNTLLSLVFIVIGTTVIAYLLTIFGLKYLKASSVGYYIYLQPLMAGIIGLIWFTEAVTWIKAIAAFLIFAGVYFVNLKRKALNEKY
ncbi:MAG: DMT family transporter [Bacteroidales bacterium]|nr:DMT family transporter [Bacteroidales bacterium]